MARPECPYCGTTEGVRHQCGSTYGPRGWIPPEYICEQCFVGQDDGPCFDDLPMACPRCGGERDEDRPDGCRDPDCPSLDPCEAYINAAQPVFPYRRNQS